jgi:predicted outer membrane repeat protein
VLLLVRDCRFVGNSASTAGGALYVQQLFPNPPANLEMVVGPYDPNYIPHRRCSANTSDGAAREWDYGWGGVQIEESTFSRNRAGNEVTEAVGGSNNGGGFGGALHAANFKITVNSTTFTRNWAGSSGGAVFLAAGSARLSLLGTTRLDGNAAVETGSAVYSASGGEIAIMDHTLIEFVPLQAAPGLTILTGGKLVCGVQGPRMQCAPGEQLVYNITSFVSTCTDWKIDCARVVVAANGSNFTFVNPTCYQLQYADSPLQVMPCNGLPISPPVVITTGTTRCIPCAGDLYSLEQATKSSNKTLSTFKCYQCPYGASE